MITNTRSNNNNNNNTIIVIIIIIIIISHLCCKWAFLKVQMTSEEDSKLAAHNQRLFNWKYRKSNSPAHWLNIFGKKVCLSIILGCTYVQGWL